MSVAETFAKYSTDNALHLEGIVAIAEEEMKLDLAEDISFYVLAWKLDAKTPTQISRDEWTSGMSNLGCKTIKDVIARLPGLRAEITSKANFTKFYKWLFQWSKESLTARVVKKDAAVGNWELILKTALPTGKWTHTDDWIDFIENKYAQKFVTEDLWTQLFVWISTPGSENLASYDESAAWPAAIDQFVSWKNGGKK